MSMFMPSNDEMERKSSEMFFAYTDVDVVRFEIYNKTYSLLDEYIEKGYIITKAIDTPRNVCARFQQNYKNSKNISDI